MKILALLVLFFPAVAAAQMYKCVDERGVTHYSDKPRPGCNGADVDIRGSAPSGTAAAAPSRDVRSEEAEFQRLSNAGRLFTVDAKGERKAVDDATRAARLANLKSGIDRQCR